MTTQFTPRDRLDQLVDYVRKARRYWWIVALAVIVGGALTAAFAFTRPARFQSWATLFHQERIQSSLLQGRDQGGISRNIGERYRDLLLARGQLQQIIEDPAINPFPDELASGGVDVAVDELRQAIDFQVRGLSSFRIVYTDSDAARAKAVTDRLTELLQAKDMAVRQDQALTTAKFAQEQRAQALDDLRVQQRALAEFLAAHPEFAQETGGGGSEGASIRAAQVRPRTPSTSGNPRVSALERQRSRIRARLDAPAGGTVVREPSAPSSEQIAAQAAVSDAQREVTAADRSLEAALAKYTDKHPDVAKAREAVASAQQRLRRAEAAVPRDEEVVIAAPASAADRTALEQQLREVEGQLAAERARERGGSSAPVPVTADDRTDRIVNLETTYAELRQRVDEQRERVEAQSQSVFRAQSFAEQQIAENASSLTVVDPAFKPIKPFGKGKKFMLLAGLVVFAGIGMALALALALVDDRIYRRADIEHMQLAPVLAVIPHGKSLGKPLGKPPGKLGRAPKQKASS